MDLLIKSHHTQKSQSLPSLKTPPSSIFGSPLHSSHTSFPIIAIVIIGILATALLLVSYYIFVIKCCLTWHRIDLLQRFSFSRRRHAEDPSGAYSPATERQGLDQTVIQSIPIFQFKKAEKDQRSLCECSVCLNEFQEKEKLRIIPNCGHAFHIDCIDVWLQNNANCPLCRSSVSATTPFALNQQPINRPTSSRPSQDPTHESFIGRDEDFVIIELAQQNNVERVQERLKSGEIRAASVSHSPRKMEQRIGQRKIKRFNSVLSMGDECLDIRPKENQFLIQPMRRSFSVDSATDPQLHLAIQEIVKQSRNISEVISSSEACSSRVRIPFFSFGHGRGSRNAVLPIQLDT